jgi:DNA-directed RNA polymerase specialized sigma24 family protein
MLKEEGTPSMDDPGLSQLSPEDRILARMYLDEHRPLKEIAEEMGIPVAKVPDRLVHMVHALEEARRRAR